MIQKLQPLLQAVAQPLHSLIGDVSAGFQFGGDKLAADEMVKACGYSCADQVSLYATTKWWQTPEGQHISTDTFVKQMYHLKSLTIPQIHTNCQGIFDRQFEHALDKCRQRVPAGEQPRFVAAFDFHEQPVNVNMKSTSPLKRYVHRRPKPNKYGTKTKHQYVLRFLTCSLVEPFHHVLGVCLITPLDTDKQWQYLTQMAGYLYHRFGVSRYLMDREFYNYDVISWFESEEAEGMEYMMPVPESPGINPVLGKAELDLSVFEGTYLEYILNRPYTLKTSKGNTDTTLNLIAKRSFLAHQTEQRFNRDSREKRMKPFEEDHKLIAFATNITEPLSYKLIDAIYKKRWGIENGYREVERLMPLTSTRNIKVRIYWFALACMLENVWETARKKQQMSIFDFQKVVKAICKMRDREIRELLEAARYSTAALESIHRFAIRKQMQLARLKGGPKVADHIRRERLERVRWRRGIKPLRR